MFGDRIDEHMNLENAWKGLRDKFNEITDFGLRLIKKEELLENPESAYLVAKAKEISDESMIVAEKTVEQILKIDDVIKTIGKNEDNAIHRYDNLKSEIDRLKENQNKILEKLDVILDKRNEKK